MHERVAALSARWEPRVGRPARPPRRGEHRPGGGRHHRRRVRGRLRGDRRHRQHRVTAAERRRVRRDPREPVHAPADRARLPPGPGGRDRDEGEEPAARRLPARGGAQRSAAPGAACGALGLSAPMVGRTDELGQMVAAFEEMLGGRAQVVSLTGEAGVGKSRLLQEWLATLEASSTARVRERASRGLLVPRRAAVRGLCRLLPGSVRRGAGRFARGRAAEARRGPGSAGR